EVVQTRNHVDRTFDCHTHLNSGARRGLHEIRSRDQWRAYRASRSGRVLRLARRRLPRIVAFATSETFRRELPGPVVLEAPIRLLAGGGTIEHSASALDSANGRDRGCCVSRARAAGHASELVSEVTENAADDNL